MQIDSNNLIRKLPAMIQGRRKFAKIEDGGDYHVGEVDNWCLTYKEVVQAIEDYCEYIDTGKFRLSAPINGNWNVLNAYPYKDVTDINVGDTIHRGDETEGEKNEQTD